MNIAFTLIEGGIVFLSGFGISKHSVEATPCLTLASEGQLSRGLWRKPTVNQTLRCC